MGASQIPRASAVAPRQHGEHLPNPHWVAGPTVVPGAWFCPCRATRLGSVCRHCCCHGWEAPTGI